jgi:hypothetical protein
MSRERTPRFFRQNATNCQDRAQKGRYKARRYRCAPGFSPWWGFAIAGIGNVIAIWRVRTSRLFYGSNAAFSQRRTTGPPVFRVRVRTMAESYLGS